MNVLTERFDDLLKPLGTIIGIFLVLAALGTIAGAPWTVQASIVSALLQIVGALLMAGLGAGLAYLSWSDDE